MITVQKHSAAVVFLSNLCFIFAIKCFACLFSQEGEDLISGKHYASEDIQTRIQEVSLSSQALEADSLEKRNRLQEAYQALMFNRQCDDMESWMDDVETQLASEDHGKDVTTVINLLKKHQVRRKIL